MSAIRILRLSDHARPGEDFHHHLATASEPPAPHAHDFYEIMAVLSGRMHVTTNGHLCPLKENDLMLSRPQDHHGLSVEGGAPNRFLNLAFSAALMQSIRTYLGETEQWDLLLNASSPPVCHARPLLIQRLRQRMADISMLAPDDRTHHSQLFRLLLAELFAECFLNPTREASCPTWLQHLLEEMVKPENLRIGLPALHQLAGLHPDSVSRAFRRCLNTTPTAWLQETRLSLLANQLAHSDEEILTLVLDAGFENLSHCYHLFGKRFGCAPGAWRKQYRMGLP